MPQGSPVSSAKAALDKANAFTKSVEGANKGMYAPKPVSTAAPATPAPKPTASQNDMGTALAWRAKQQQALPKMHQGGMVPDDGAYEMQKGEMVIPRDAKNAMHEATKALGKKGSDIKTHVRIEPVEDGAYHVINEEHGDETMTHKTTKHAPANLDALIEHIKKTYGAVDDNKA